MQIDIVTLPIFTQLNIEESRGNGSGGGGMAVLMNAAKSVLMERYKLNFFSKLDECESDFVIIDALAVARPGKTGSPPADKQLQFIDAIQNDIDQNPNRKYLLWCAELSFFRWLPSTQKNILRFIPHIVVTDPYLWQLFKAINIAPLGFLCDSIDSDLFRPNQKEMVVTSVGALKHIKNVDWILEVYRLLEGKIKRIYVGGSQLWSPEKRPEDMALVQKIQNVTEEHYSDVSVVQVAYHNSYSAFAINDTWHDCSSRSNEELLMSGVISIHGRHPLFRGRPGFTVTTPQEAVDTIAKLTDNFSRLPDKALFDRSREWALQNVSSNCFLKQFELIIKGII